MSPTLEAPEVITPRVEQIAATVRQALTGEGQWARARLALMLAVAVLCMATAPPPVLYLGLLALFGITLDLARRR